jgi:hypothetical protein
MIIKYIKYIYIFYLFYNIKIYRSDESYNIYAYVP